MTQIPAPKDLGTKLYLLTIQGTFKPATLEEARITHNQTAGSDGSIAASTALGDLSHNVYVRCDREPEKGAGEALFIDLWNSIQGLQQFFADPQVQQGGSMIFTERDPVVWVQSEGMPHIYLPSPRRKSDRVIGLARGKIRSLAEAREVLQAVTAKGLNASRRRGHVSRDYYLRADGDHAELLGMDVWQSAEGAYEFYSKIEDFGALGKIFEGAPETSVWRQPEGEWIEW